MSLGSHGTTHAKEGVEDTSTIVTPQWSFMGLFMWLSNEGDTVFAIEIWSSLSDDLSCTIFRLNNVGKRDLIIQLAPVFYLVALDVD